MRRRGMMRGPSSTASRFRQHFKAPTFGRSGSELPSYASEMDLDPSSITKAGLGSSGYAVTTGSRLMQGLDPIGYAGGDMARGAIGASSDATAELEAMIAQGAASTETKIMSWENESQVRFYNTTSADQDLGLPGNPETVEQAALMSVQATPGRRDTSDLYQSPEKISVIASEGESGLKPEYADAFIREMGNRSGMLGALPMSSAPGTPGAGAAVTRSSGLVQSASSYYDAQHGRKAAVNYNPSSNIDSGYSAGGTPSRATTRQAAVASASEAQGNTDELLRVAQRQEDMQRRLAPRPAAVSHPGMSQYQGATDTGVSYEAAAGIAEGAGDAGYNDVAEEDIETTTVAAGTTKWWLLVLAGLGLVGGVYAIAKK